jgi:hypothetical protein
VAILTPRVAAYSLLGTGTALTSLMLLSYAGPTVECRSPRARRVAQAILFRGVPKAMDGNPGSARRLRILA